MAYFIPSIVACVLRHRQVGWLFALNLSLGWTLVIWVVCLGWAVTPEKDSSDGECG
jgi:hypothetical protein